MFAGFDGFLPKKIWYTLTQRPFKYNVYIVSNILVCFLIPKETLAIKAVFLHLLRH
jgi:hypothetical protein